MIVTRADRRDSEKSEVSAERFHLWVERLIRIGIETREVRCALADAGVICGATPEVRSSDPPRVVRMKETLRGLIRQKRKVRTEMARVGARVADEQTWEILVSGGPTDEACLSWILGERAVGYYRETDSPLSKRHRLPGVAPETVDPVRH